MEHTPGFRRYQRILSWGGLLAAVVVMTTLCSSLAVAQPRDPLSVAREFLETMLAGDSGALARQHTDDAVLIAGDIGAPLSGLESALTRPEWKLCTIETLTVLPERVAVDVLGQETPASVKSGNATRVKGTLVCPTPAGTTRRSDVSIIVAENRVALLALNAER